MYQLVFFVPSSHLEEVKQAVFDAGGGQIGHYEACCWQSKGLGQFIPKEGANPTMGDVGVLTEVEEYRVELFVKMDAREACEAALKLSHPYEVPAYHFLRVDA